MGGRPEVRILGPEHVGEVVSVLSESFYDYPVMRYVLETLDDYDGHLQTLIHFFVMARVLRGEALLGIGDADALDAAALVSRPELSSPPGVGELRERVWMGLGPEARARYEALGAAWASFEVAVPQIHLNMIGVRRRAQGEGLGRRLIDAVHGMSEDDPTSEGVSLTTESEANVALYQYLGYEIIGRTEVARDLTTWGFFRTDASHDVL